MTGVSAHDLTVLLAAIALLVGAGRALGELAQRFALPTVLGELLAGVLLGPSILGRVAPHWVSALFPETGPAAVGLQAVSLLGIVLFLMVAGLEVDLSTVWRQGRVAMLVSGAGIVLPFLAGLAAGYWIPVWFHVADGTDRITFAVFFAAALSISALPVIAKTMIDLNLYRSDLGMLVIAAAVVDDLVGWNIFGIVLGMIGAGPAWSDAAVTVGLTLAFAVFTLTALRWGVHRVLPSIQAHTSWPAGVIGFTVVLACIGGAFTEWIGVHAVFGAFLVGVAVGDSSHLRAHTRTVLHQFIAIIFAPLFFGSIGLRVDFVTHFDPLLCAIVFVVACITKIVGCTAGARIGGMAPREALATGFALNARGAMEIILGLLALQKGVINERMFVALVVMALGTSLLSGPVMRYILRLERPMRLGRLLNPRGFVSDLRAADRMAAIRELVAAVCDGTPLPRANIEDAVLTREAVLPTGLGNGVAVPHARVEGLNSSILGVGLSTPGVDFDAPDGEPAQLVFLILTPRDDDGAQVKVLAEIARMFANPRAVADALKARTFTEFLAVANAQVAGH